jgi:ABA responsive element binding factor
VSKVSRLEEENIKLKKEKVGRIFHFNQAVFYFFFREHLSTTPRGKMKEMAK